MRLAMYAGICDSMELVPLAELKFKLRQVRRYAAALPPMTEQEMMKQARALSFASLETLNGPDTVEGGYYKLLFLFLHLQLYLAFPHT